MWTYFFINWLAKALKNKLVGFRFGEIFSQNKDELIIGFYNDKSEQFYWVLNFEASFPNMKFYDSYSRAKKNSINLFNELLDSEIADLVPHEFERSFHIKTKRNQVLIFKLHGAKSNIILKSDEETVLFRHNLSNDLNFNLKDYLGNNFDFNEEETSSLNNFRFLDKYSKNYGY
jgi:predicted ribosome quality control (RQC) complex YloA/Tae2 family protein